MHTYHSRMSLRGPSFSQRQACQNRNNMFSSSSCTDPRRWSACSLEVSGMPLCTLKWGSVVSTPTRCKRDTTATRSDRSLHSENEPVDGTEQLLVLLRHRRPFPGERKRLGILDRTRGECYGVHVLKADFEVAWRARNASVLVADL